MRRLLPLVLLGGCTNLADHSPSLAPRPVESRSIAEPEVVPVPVTSDPALDSRIAERVAAVDAATKAFAEQEASTTPLVQRAAKAPAGSDAWLDAQTALSILGNARAVTAGAVADLNALAIEHAENGGLPYPALDAALARASAEADRQDQLVGRLSALIER